MLPCKSLRTPPKQLPRIFGRALRPFSVSGIQCQVKFKSYNNKSISLSIEHKTVLLNNIFLRDACDSLRSRDPYSKQKLFTTGSLDVTIRPAREPRFITREDANSSIRGLQVDWSDGASSFYTEEFLRRYANAPQNCGEGRDLKSQMLYWDLETLRENEQEIVHNITYDKYMNDEKTLFTALDNLNKYGMVFINDIPEGKEFIMPNGKWAIENIAERIAYIRETFYGRLFDVKNIKEATNIAYTSTYLPLHMDLCYYEAPPGIQILHALQNSTEGGDNVFADSYRAALYVKEADQAAYDALLKVPINYHYDHTEYYYAYSRPLITEDPVLGGIKEIAYSPPFQAPFERGILEQDAHLFESFMRGMKLFEGFLNDPKNQYVIKTNERSAVLFNNRRTLHARKEFREVGAHSERWLKGCYLDGDAFDSKLRVLYRKYGAQ
ncbi:hypothetical protein BABINDRAFT_7908 [Babjeviella inositovora NRRL Y-12698]|uniref:TauD/TfdA-like domain-containing protein n=1 Tax=Babjeviella inositovora NRRL Y-12698 TaxID=984486 RepID=A0A1E3QPU9_9ASCO|nr:uncharacterized protein BABINDRAFT_7908 [Babjeviella inositovora NRRL Y-12698]ODQ79691.1 hypothetical protein BABINDRAFT_7908 [Babjeviella inositovora NRRL Y-12698]